MPRPVKPIDIRGTVYPSRKAAAETLGVTQQAILKAEKGGWLENVGLGRQATAARRAAGKPRETECSRRLLLAFWHRGRKCFVPLTPSDMDRRAGVMSVGDRRRALEYLLTAGLIVLGGRGEARRDYMLTEEGRVAAMELVGPLE